MAPLQLLNAQLDEVILDPRKLIMMRTLFCFIVAFLLAADVRADARRYQSRMVGAAHVELQPLFAWWTFASQTTNQPLNLTEMDTNNFAALSNLWLRLPGRPLLDWFDIKVSEDKITVVGSMWKIDATIAPAPMMFSHQTIYLRNPPEKEIQGFKLARAAATALQNAQGGDVAAELLWENNIQAEAASAQAPNLQDTVTAAGNLNDLNGVHYGTLTQDRKLTQVKNFIATFPDPQVYWLDHFALRTGEAIDGIEVYDLGTAPGLTF
jgi:hypothetical protein